MQALLKSRTILPMPHANSRLDPYGKKFRFLRLRFLKDNLEFAPCKVKADFF